MKLFDVSAFEKVLEEFDDTKIKFCLGEYGIANIPEGSDDVLELFKPFLDFSKAEKPADIDISVDALVGMADELENLVELFTGGSALNCDSAMKNIESIKGLKRRRVL